MDKIKNIIILGGLGDGVVAASMIKDIEEYDNSMKVLGFLNNSGENFILDYPVLGDLNEWKKFVKDDVYFISALLKTKYSYERMNLVEKLNIPLNKFCNVIHPSATVSKYTEIGVGNLIAPNVNIMPNTKIANHCSFRSGVSVGHDCIIENFCYLGPNAVMSGRSILKDGAHMGPNSSLLDSKTIGNHAVLGIGSVATKNIDNFKVYFGIPAKKIGITFK